MGLMIELEVGRLAAIYLAPLALSASRALTARERTNPQKG
jgi:hypothetical protein